MIDVKQANAEIATLNREAKAILDEHRKRGENPKGEVAQKLEKMFGRVLELKGEVEDSEKWDARQRDAEKIQEWLEKPIYTMPRPGEVGNDPDETKVALGRIGWEAKGGMLYAPTSLGKMVPMFQEEVLVGPYPDPEEDEGGSATRLYKSWRAIFQPNYQKSFKRWLRLAVKHRDQAMAFSQLTGDEQKALSEGTDVAGGYLVPPDVQAEVLVRIPMAAVMRNLARVIPTSRDILVFPRIQPNAGAGTQGSIFTSGFVGDWAGETPVFTDVNPLLGAFTVPVRKIRAATKVSNDLVADSVFPFLSFLATDGSTNIALVEDYGFLVGNGAGAATFSATGPSLQPLGLLYSGSPTVDVTGTTAHTISNTNSATGSWPSIIKLQANLPQQYQPNANWIVHRLTEANIRLLIDGNFRPLFAPGYMSPTGSLAEQFNTLQGKGLYRSDFVPQDGATGTVLVYGDIRQYFIAQRAGISVTILRERFADTDQTGVILWERVGGALWNTDAVRLGTVT